jgi:signal transduction histidine kinase/ActR/RegA family two-component response regulator
MQSIRTHESTSSLATVQLRDETASQRDEAAQKRDELATRHDREADIADQRLDDLEAGDGEAGAPGLEDRRRAARDRQRAKHDRRLAGADRAFGESDREQSRLDRKHVELVEASERAESANRAKSEFLSRISHELRTPLNAILGFGQLLELDELDARQLDHVEHILKAGRHLLELINEVLEISRIEAGELTLSLAPVPLAETVREVLALMEPLAAQRDLRLAADTSGLGANAHVQADRQRLTQVLLNVVSNAIKYDRAGGHVDVSFVLTDGGRIRTLIADTGSGIAADRLSDLFEPFERLGAERGDVEGTGLGLALSKRLVETMGGTISVESVPGQGSTFAIELAGAETPNDPAEIDGAVEPESRSGLSGRVLYIEDNLSNLTLVERIMDRHPGVELVTAMQGRLGLDLATERHPDLIVLDLHLPDVPGYEVLRCLKADAATRAIPVVVLSADASKKQVERLLSLGAREYVTKPLDVKHFLEVVAENLELSARLV